MTIDKILEVVKRWVEEETSPGFGYHIGHCDDLTPYYNQLRELLEKEEPQIKGLDEAEMRDSIDYVDGIPGGGTDKHPWNDHDIEKAYYDGMLAGAKWMAGQGVKFDTEMSWLDSFGFQIGWPEDTSIFDCFNPGDKVVVQIRKK